MKIEKLLLSATLVCIIIFASGVFVKYGLPLIMLFGDGAWNAFCITVGIFMGFTLLIYKIAK
tara:strand:+ start:10584 stop:10769 length:186 start_codon:yes stop_codon:yes gene_type:complete